MQDPEREQETYPDSARIALQFPTLAINGRVVSWVLQSEQVNMATNTEEHTYDDTASSLGDSAYEFIDDSSISVATSDEDDQELTGRYSSSGDEHENEHEQEQKYTQQHHRQEQAIEPEHEQADRVKDEGNDSSGDSQFTEFSNSSVGFQDSSAAGNSVEKDIESIATEQSRELERDVHFGPSCIVFEEPKALNLHPRDEINVSHVVKAFSDQETYDMLSQIGTDWKAARLVATIRQSMTQRGFSVDEPYRLLYMGDPSAKAAIVSKIAAALNSNQEHEKLWSQRFNVVPISSFGAGSSPEVELIDSFGPGIIIDECTSATSEPTTSGRDSIHITLNNYYYRVSSTWNGSRFVVGPKWKQPDIAVFYISNNDDTGAKQIRKRVRSFTGRHAIPAIIISESPLWGRARELLTLDHRSLHLCLEGDGSEGRENRVLRRLPVDLPTFLQVDVKQLGRNLACLSSATGGLRLTKEEYPTESGDPSDDVEKSPLDLFAFKGNLRGIRNYKAPEIRSLLVLGSVLLLSMVYTIATLSLQKFTQVSPQAEISRNLLISSISTVSTSATKVSSVMSSTSATVRPSAVPSVSTHDPISKIVSDTRTNTDLASFLLDSHSLAPNKSGQFKIHVIRDCHIVLKPPPWFTLLRRAPKLLFKVTRKEETVDYQVSTLFDGLYVLKLPIEHAHGTLIVSVWTKSMPRIDESFQVDFGTPWLKVAGWKRAAQILTEQIQRDWSTAQTRLAEVVSHTNTGLRILMEDAARIADGIRRKAESIRKTSLNQTSKTTDLMLTQTKVLSCSVSRNLRGQGLAASKRLTAEGGKVKQELAGRAREASRLMSHYARAFSQAATGVDVREIAQEIAIVRRHHLRETQKKALRLWWRIRGIP